MSPVAADSFISSNIELNKIVLRCEASLDAFGSVTTLSKK